MISIAVMECMVKCSFAVAFSTLRHRRRNICSKYIWLTSLTTSCQHVHVEQSMSYEYDPGGWNYIECVYILTTNDLKGDEISVRWLVENAR